MTDEEALEVVQELFGELGSVHILPSSVPVVERYEVGWVHTGGSCFWCCGENWIDALEYLRDNPEPELVVAARLRLQVAVSTPEPEPEPRLELSGNAFADMLGL